MLTYNKRLNHIHIIANGLPDCSEDKKYGKQLFSSQDTQYYFVYLEHSDTCPNRIYRMLCQQQNVPIKYSPRNVKLAVCMAILDSEDKLLLTRRTAGMKIFPQAWVMPGGHTEIGESLEESVIREIFEETGIKIAHNKENDGTVSYKHNGKICEMDAFYAFESVSSRVIDISHEEPPHSAHLIVFFRVKLNSKAENLKMILMPQEVDAALWLSKENIRKVFSLVDGDVQGISIGADGYQYTKTFQLSQLFPNYPNEKYEGISKAHNFAIRYLFKSYYQMNYKL